MSNASYNRPANVIAVLLGFVAAVQASIAAGAIAGMNGCIDSLDVAPYVTTCSKSSGIAFGEGGAAAVAAVLLTLLLIRPTTRVLVASAAWCGLSVLVNLSQQGDRYSADMLGAGVAIVYFLALVISATLLLVIVLETDAPVPQRWPSTSPAPSAGPVYPSWPADPHA